MKVMDFDVVCIGGGGASVTAAVAASRLCRVALVSKEPVGYGDTRMAAGSMVHPGLSEEDDEKVFFEDMMFSGEGLNNPDLVSVMSEKAAGATTVVEEFGAIFRRDAKGNLGFGAATRSGGHTFPRSLICPPTGGVVIGNALRAAVSRSGAAVMEETAVCRIMVSDNQVRGALCFSLKSGEVFIIRAKAVILATGGGGWLYYPSTDCSRGSTGDGYSLGYQAGAGLTDMEQVQFVPFGLTYPAAFRGLFLGEPNLAGPAGVLKNSRGKIIMDSINVKTRAAVTRAMAEEIDRGGCTPNGGLYLDLSDNLSTEKGRAAREDMVQKGQLEILRKAYGEKCYQWLDLIEVAPTAHYFMGGIKVDVSCMSTVNGLFAAGQVLGGVHGGNRLGSTSLAELFVFGNIAGEKAAYYANNTLLGELPKEEDAEKEIKALFGSTGDYPPCTLIKRLQNVMQKYLWVLRDARGLGEALSLIADLEDMAGSLRISREPVYNTEILEALELRHMLVTARAVAASALERDESCGAHVRKDFTLSEKKSETYNVMVRKDSNKMLVARVKVG